MNIIERLKIVLKSLYDEDCRFMLMERLGLCDRLSDEEYLKRKYHMMIGKSLNLDKPDTFSEKLQWLKLHDRKDIYTVMVDKYLVKGYVSDIIGEEYIIPTLGVWDTPGKIDFESLPNQFVLKCNHNSGTGMCICQDKTEIDIDTVKKSLQRGLNQDYYLYGREWPYKNIKKKIICEKFMETADDKDKLGLIDYKFFCFNGVPKFLYIAQGAAKEYKSNINFIDFEWNLMPFQRSDHPQFAKLPEKPLNFDKMLDFARKLSVGIPFVRIDFYNIDGKIYFGELTFFPGSGYIPFFPKEYDFIIGSWIDLFKERTNDNY